MNNMDSIDAKSFASNQMLHTSHNNSYKMFFRKKQYACSLCDKSFSTPLVLTEHEQTHKGVIFSCYLCGEVTKTLTKMIVHKRIHIIEDQILSLPETNNVLDISDELIEIESGISEEIIEIEQGICDELIEIDPDISEEVIEFEQDKSDELIEIELDKSDELIEIEPLSIKVDKLMMDESLGNQRPKQDNSNKVISNEHKNKHAKDVINKIMNIQAGEKATGNQNKNISYHENTSSSSFKTIENESSICNNYENITGKEIIVNDISNVKRSKRLIRKKDKKMVRKLNTLNYKSLEENKHNTEQASSIASAISDTKTFSICKKVKNPGSIIEIILNESDSQDLENENDFPCNKNYIKSTKDEFANENIDNDIININICQMSSKEEIQDILKIDKSSQNVNHNVEDFKTNKIMSENRDVIKFQCVLCDYKSKNRNNLHVHKKTHQSKKDNKKVEKFKKEVLNSVNYDVIRFKCNQCDYQSKHRSSLYIHKKRHRTKESLKCQHCNFKTKYKGLMDRHLKRHMRLNETRAKNSNYIKLEKVITLNKNMKNIEKDKIKKISILKKNISIDKRSDGLVNKSLLVYNEIDNSDKDLMDKNIERNMKLNEIKEIESNINEKQKNIINKNKMNLRKSKREKYINKRKKKNETKLKIKISSMLKKDIKQNKNVDALVNRPIESGNIPDEIDNSDKGFMDRNIHNHMILKEGKTEKQNNNVQQTLNIDKKNEENNKRKQFINKKKTNDINKRKKVSVLKNYINIDKKLDGLINTSQDNGKIQNEIDNSDKAFINSFKERPIILNESTENNELKIAKIKTLLNKNKKSNKITYKCKDCDYKCQTLSRMKMHSQTHSDERPFLCPFCEYKAKSRGPLRVHVRIHTGEKPYSCPECNYCSTTSTSLKKHVMIHTGEKPLKCPICDYRCIQGNALKSHIKTHSNEKYFKCPQCSYTDKHKTSFQLHLASHN